MKLLIASDIHGSAYWCRALMARIEAESPRHHRSSGGPSLSRSAKRPSARLRAEGGARDAEHAGRPRRCRARQLRQRGRPDGARFSLHGRLCDRDGRSTCGGLRRQPASKAEPRLLFCTHGHLFGPQNVPPIARGAALLYGHTHVKEIASRDGVLFVNPGSVSLPKDGSNSYAIYENGTFELRELVGE